VVLPTVPIPKITIHILRSSIILKATQLSFSSNGPTEVLEELEDALGQVTAAQRKH